MTAVHSCLEDYVEDIVVKTTEEHHHTERPEESLHQVLAIFG